MNTCLAAAGFAIALQASSLAAQQTTQPSPAAAAFTVTYIANEGFLIEAAGKKVLVDSLFDAAYGNLAPPQEVLDQLTAARGPFADVDLVLVTHSHGDHLNPKLVAAHLRNNPRARLIAHTQAVDQLRREQGFAETEAQIQEVGLDPGSRKHLTVNGVAVEVLGLPHGPYYKDGRNVHEQVRNLAFIVDLGGTRFLHLGDATVENSLAHLNAYRLDATRVDVLFVGYLDRSPATREFIARKIKPSRIIAMHVPPAELKGEVEKTWAAYPWAIVFKQSMEQRSLPIEIDFHRLTGDYVGQSPPGATPQVFARGIVSTDNQEHGAPSFSPDGNEVIWVSARKPGPDNDGWIATVLTMRRENGRWSAPYVPALERLLAFSAGGRRGYFNAPRPGAAQPGARDDIWFVERQGDKWSEPTCLNFVARYPELRFAFWPTIARNGSLYFGAYAPGPLNDYGIYRAELVNGEYAKAELLPRSINLPPFLNWTPFPAPDETYLLFSSDRRDPEHDGGDLFVSHRLTDGRWTDPVSLGEPVNTSQQERLPALSNDGKYLFFSRETPDHGEDVFWVDAATVRALRATDAPVSLIAE